MKINGYHSIIFCLKQKPHLLKKVYLSWENNNKNKFILNLCEKEKIPVQRCDALELNKIIRLKFKKQCSFGAEIYALEFYSLSEMMKVTKKFGLLIAIDQIHNVANLGAIIRSSYALGADGVIISRHHQGTINSTVIHTSSGTVFGQKIAVVSNLSQALLQLKKNNFFILGADTSPQSVNYTTVNYKKYKKCLILGNEEHGIRKKIIDKCDELIKIPLYNNFDSLNVSVAAAILINYLVNINC